MDGNGPEWLGMACNECEWLGMDWEWMGMDWEWMVVDSEWMGMSE